MGAHIVNGQFQSDKYPTCPAGKVPLSIKDQTAQDLLWEYAQRRRKVDSEFSDDLEDALRTAGYVAMSDEGGQIEWARKLARMWMNRALENYGRIQELEARLHELLARIHGDGGHYAVEHGLAKACEDADAIVVALLAKS